MKKAIKLLVLAGALLSVGAMAAESQTQTWNYNFPQFMALFSSVAIVNFDFLNNIDDGNTTSGLPTSAYPRASSTALNTCLNDIDPDEGTGTSTIETVNEGSLSASNTSCSFAPSDLDKNFDVNWNSGDSEGALIAISNVETKIQVKVDTSPTSGIHLMVANSKTSATEPTFQEISTTDSDFITGLPAGINYLPLTFALKVDIANVAPISNAEVRTVTYTITTP